MRQTQRFLGITVLTLLISTSNMLQAQPDPNVVGKAANPPVRQPKVRRQKAAANQRLNRGKLTPERLAIIAPRLAEREIEQLEAMYGQKLTETQKKAVIESTGERYKAVLDAQQKHNANVAQSLGVTVEELALKQKAYLQLNRGKAARGNAAINKQLLRDGVR